MTTTSPSEAAGPPEPSADAELTADGIPLAIEHARSMRLEMVYSPDGPDTDALSEEKLRGLAYGSAFLYKTAERTYLVTARHNLTGRHPDTNDWLGEYSLSPTHLRVTILAKPSGQGWRLTPSDVGDHVAAVEMRAKAFLIPLIGEDWAPIWLEHPLHGAAMDVAALPFELADDELLIESWSSPSTATNPTAVKWPDLAPGQDLFVVGYPFSLASGPLFPLWIRGTIASEPRFGYAVNDQILPLMLVDARTRKGQSGSAVIRNKPAGTVVPTVGGSIGITAQTTSQLVGVYSGRTSDESDLGFVWRIDEVEILCQRGVRASA
ncbi:MAG: trypsin-like peptidase domain-containing protein [Mycobacterium sp.]